ncbi:MAG TPA: nucleotide exchange factor GrpE [Polyangiales bacterium]|nr:nucleotide exchange factor GrpE [Polyangiales bacterium]
MNTNNESSNNSVGDTADDTPRSEAGADAASESRAPEAAGPSRAPGAPSRAPEAVASTGNGPTDPSAERDALKDQLLRTAADFDNFRKRARREMEDAKTRGKDEAIKEILPVFDNLERAVAAAENAQAISSVIEGVKMVLKLFEDTADRMGLKRIKTVGERFDPAVHEAIQQQETDAHPPGTILTEVVPGYTFGQRLLRASMVVVARKPNKPAAETGANGEAKGGGASA